MTVYSLCGQLPKHRYIFVDTKFTHKEPRGFIPAIWFGLVSFPGRVWGCTVALENGAVYRNLPPHALAFRCDPSPIWTPQDAQTWDCYGTDFTVLEYRYIAAASGLKVRANGNEHLGEYLFTAAPVGDGFSAAPEQAKEFTFAALQNGRLTIQPTNHVLVLDKSFTENAELAFPKGMKRQTEIYACER